MSKHDIRDDELHVRQNKMSPALRIRLYVEGQPTGLGACVDRLLAQLVQPKNGELICADRGQPLTATMLRGRFEHVRVAAAS